MGTCLSAFHTYPSCPCSPPVPPIAVHIASVDLLSTFPVRVGYCRCATDDALLRCPSTDILFLYTYNLACTPSPSYRSTAIFRHLPHHTAPPPHTRFPISLTTLRETTRFVRTRSVLPHLCRASTPPPTPRLPHRTTHTHVPTCHDPRFRTPHPPLPPPHLRTALR